jgi:hypothetical protein
VTRQISSDGHRTIVPRAAATAFVRARCASAPRTPRRAEAIGT